MQYCALVFTLVKSGIQTSVYSSCKTSIVTWGRSGPHVGVHVGSIWNPYRQCSLQFIVVFASIYDRSKLSLPVRADMVGNRSCAAEPNRAGGGLKVGWWAAECKIKWCLVQVCAMVFVLVKSGDQIFSDYNSTTPIVSLARSRLHFGTHVGSIWDPCRLCSLFMAFYCSLCEYFWPLGTKWSCQLPVWVNLVLTLLSSGCWLPLLSSGGHIWPPWDLEN